MHYFIEETEKRDEAEVNCLETYKRRVLCRVELFTHYFRPGWDAMCLRQQGAAQQRAELTSVEQSWRLDAFLVIGGEYTCHPVRLLNPLSA